VIVLDASALVELLLNTPVGQKISARIENPVEGVHVPHLVDLEVIQALRRYVREEELDVEDALAAIEDLRALDLQRHAHEPMLDRVWELRNNITAYDAVYVALAEVLDTKVVTCDGPFSRARGVAGRVELVQAEPADRH
jgi:predicted nucleic acid-binding protein